MRLRTRRALWDLISVLAMIGLAYGAWEIIAIKGWGLGVPMAIIAAIFGYICFEVIYPLWFGRS